MKKKILGILLGFLFIASLAACNDKDNNKKPDDSQNPTENPVETPLMDYATFMSKESGDDVKIQGYIAAKQSWWADKATLYLYDGKGAGYFIYNCPMTQEEYNKKYTVGTCVEVTGTKTIYSGEHEIMGENLKEIKVVEDVYAMDQIALDISNNVTTAALKNYQNAYFTATLKVKEYTAANSNTKVSENKAWGYKGDTPTDDLYFLLEDRNGNTLSCCVEYYLTNENSAVYKTLLENSSFKVGAYVKVTGYLYFYNDNPDAHITSVNIIDLDENQTMTLTYETFRAANNGDSVSVAGYLVAKTTYYNGKTNLYIADPIVGGYYVYDYACTQDQYNSLTTFIAGEDAVYVSVIGKKATYAGLEEIIDATVTVVAGEEPDGINALDVNEALESGATLDIYQAACVYGYFEVVEYTTTDKNAHVAESKAWGYKGDTPTDDLYVNLKDVKTGTVISFCVEAYVDYGTGKEDLYNAVKSLKIGDKVDIGAFLYWWYGPNPHLVFVYAY